SGLTTPVHGPQYTLRLSGGNVVGGTINSPDGTPLQVVRGASNRLKDLTLDADVNVLGGATLTLSGVSVGGHTITTAGNGTAALAVLNDPSRRAFTNRGTILAAGPSSTLSMTGTFTNNGLIRVDAGASVVLAGAWDNSSGTIQVNGGSVTFGSLAFGSLTAAQ